jgi:hypothetical protein
MSRTVHPPGEVGATTHAPNRAGRRRAWPKRRSWLDRIACEDRLTAGAKTWLLLLARRSDDSGKPVWGNQVRMGEQIGRCDRSVRRYRAEAETLGYVDCYRSKPLRDPHTGRWGRRKSNTYYLRLPARQKATEPAPRRHVRAPACIVPRSHPSRQAPFHPADSNTRSSPIRGASTTPAPPVRSEPVTATHPTTDPAAARQRFAEMRALLKR